MTPDETIEQQARREAEAIYYTMPWEKEEDRQLFEELNAIAVREQRAYAAALVAERSKPHPSVDEHVHTLYMAVDGDYICSGCEMVFVQK